MSYNWHEEQCSRRLVQQLQVGEVLESREYLGPIYKWTKYGAKTYDVEKAFRFTLWMIQIQQVGDVALSIPAQRHIEPKYALNTLITMSQRANRPNDALRAFDLLKAQQMVPDVFTMTALIDVLGRSSIPGFEHAVHLYDDEMLASTDCMPNVVTYVTLFRLIGYMLPPHSSVLIKRLLDDAHHLAHKQQIINADTVLIDANSPAARVKISNNTSVMPHLGGNPATGSIDNSIYNAALAACHKLKDTATTAHILDKMQHVDARVTVVTRKILAKIMHITCGIDIHSNEGLLEVLQTRLSADVSIDQARATISYLELKFRDFPEITADNVHTPESTYAGCLGSDASESLRKSVIEHDAQKLVERLQVHNVMVTEMDFITLVHQCRKRKWPNEVKYLFGFISDLATIGMPSSHVPPQPHLTPTLHGVYEASLDAYFACGEVNQALELFNDLISRRSSAGFSSGPDEDLSSFVVFCARGFVMNGRVDMALHVYWTMRTQGLIPTRRLVLGLMRSAGRVVVDALRVLADVLNLVLSDQRHNPEDKSPTEGLSIDLIGKGLETVVESMAVLGAFDSFSHFQQWLLGDSCASQQLSNIDPDMTLKLKDSWGQLVHDENEGLIIALTLAAASFSYGSAYRAQTFLENLINVSFLKAKFNAAVTLVLCDALVNSVGPTTLSAASTVLACEGEHPKTFENNDHASLPFNTFSYYQAFGPIKVIDARRDPFRSLLRAIQKERVDRIDIPASPRDGRMNLFSILASDEDAKARVVVDDFMQLQLREFTQQYHLFPEAAYCCLSLFLYHIHIRLLAVRNKDSRSAVESSINRAISTTFQSELQGSIIQAFITNLFRAFSLLDLPGKVQSRIIKMIVDCLAEIQAPLLITAEAIVSIIASNPLLETMKLFFKEPFDLSSEARAMIASVFIGEQVRGRQERLVKIVMFIKQYDLVPHVDLTTIELHIVWDLLTAHMLGSWACLCTYLTCFNDDIGAIRSAVTRIVSLLTQRCIDNNNELQVLATFKEQSLPVLRDQTDDSIILDYVKKLLCRYDLLFLPEFQDICKDSVPIDITISVQDMEPPRPSDQFLLLESLQMSRSRILVVDTRSHLETAQAVLTSGLVSRLGIDVEWRPYSTGMPPTKCSLMQLACDSDVFLFDLLAIESDESLSATFHALLEQLLRDKQILKIGFSIQDDFKRLWDSYSTPHHPLTCFSFDIVQHCLDISKIKPLRSLSLSKICEKYLGKLLDKRVQCSDWQRRPLLEEQVVYAALDASCMLRLVDVLSNEQVI